MDSSCETVDSEDTSTLRRTTLFPAATVKAVRQHPVPAPGPEGKNLDRIFSVESLAVSIPLRPPACREWFRVGHSYQSPPVRHKCVLEVLKRRRPVCRRFQEGEDKKGSATVLNNVNDRFGKRF